MVRVTVVNEMTQQIKKEADFESYPKLKIVNRNQAIAIITTVEKGRNIR